MRKEHIIILTGAFLSALIQYLYHKLYFIGTYDYTIFLQAIQNIDINHSMFNYIEYVGHGVTTHCAVHFQPVLYLYALVYYFVHSTYVPDFFDWLGYTLLGVVAYHLYRDNDNLFIILLFWLISPAAYFYVYDAHPIVLAAPLGLLYLYFAEKKYHPGMLLTALVLFTIREDTGLFLITAGVYWLLKRDWREAATNITGGVVMMIISMAFIIHAAGGALITEDHFGFNIYSILFIAVFGTIMYIISGYPFASGKRHWVYYAAILPLFVEPFTFRYWFSYQFGRQYYVFATVGIIWALSHVHIDKKKYVAALFIVSVLLSPVFDGFDIMMGSTQIDGEFMNFHANPVQLVYDYEKYGKYYNSLSTVIPSIYSDYYSSGYDVFLDAHIYPYYYTLPGANYSNWLYHTITGTPIQVRTWGDMYIPTSGKPTTITNCVILYLSPTVPTFAPKTCSAVPVLKYVDFPGDVFRPNK